MANYLTGDIHNLDVSLKMNKAQPYQNDGSKPVAINIIVQGEGGGGGLGKGEGEREANNMNL